jgi:AsmA protein
MLAPLVRVTGAGDVPLPPRTIDYRAEAKLVSSLEGQGGNEALAGLPIPIHVKGSWDKPKIKVDWESVFQAALLDPERMAIMPDDMKGTAQGLGIAIPGFGGGGEGEGAGGVEGAIGGALNQLLGGGSDSTEEGAAPSTEEPAPSDSGETKKKKKKESEAEKLLKKLF